MVWLLWEYILSQLGLIQENWVCWICIWKIIRSIYKDLKKIEKRKQRTLVHIKILNQHKYKEWHWMNKSFTTPSMQLVPSFSKTLSWIWIPFIFTIWFWKVDILSSLFALGEFHYCFLPLDIVSSVLATCSCDINDSEWKTGKNTTELDLWREKQFKSFHF